MLRQGMWVWRMAVQMSDASPPERVVQVDTRKRLTISELEPSARYFVEKHDAGVLRLIPQRISRYGLRMVQVDARCRVSLTETTPGEFYFVRVVAHSIVDLYPAVVVPRTYLEDPA